MSNARATLLFGLLPEHLHLTIPVGRGAALGKSGAFLTRSALDRWETDFVGSSPAIAVSRTALSTAVLIPTAEKIVGLLGNGMRGRDGADEMPLGDDDACRSNSQTIGS